MSKNILRTNSHHSEYLKLIKLLDREISDKEGEQFEFYNQFNSSEHINEVVLIMHNSEALGCGAIKRFDTHSAEIKRMFTLPKSRGLGVATLILTALEKWASELGYSSCILETGRSYTEALALYEKHGFITIKKYGPYIGNEDSVCLGKKL
ncbi:MAG: GNAT family N-acetyltransferase [Flavobacteriales bacterium]